MAVVYPLTPTCSSYDYLTYRKESREVFTVWMKSLVLNGNGCTVFDSKGEIIYRIDNYDEKGGNEVYLMDLRGRVLFSIRHKKLGLFEHWDGYKWFCIDKHQEMPMFRVRNNRSIFQRDFVYLVTFGGDRSKENTYKIIASKGKSAFKLVDRRGELVAELRQKEVSSSGVALGDDVLSLVVEPQVDHSLVMAIVTVYGLIKYKL